MSEIVPQVNEIVPHERAVFDVDFTADFARGVGRDVIDAEDFRKIWVALINVAIDAQIWSKTRHAAEQVEDDRFHQHPVIDQLIEAEDALDISLAALMEAVCSRD